MDRRAVEIEEIESFNVVEWVDKDFIPLLDRLVSSARMFRVVAHTFNNPIW